MLKRKVLDPGEFDALKNLPALGDTRDRGAAVETQIAPSAFWQMP